MADFVRHRPFKLISFKLNHRISVAHPLNFDYISINFFLKETAIRRIMTWFPVVSFPPKKANISLLQVYVKLLGAFIEAH